MLSPGQDRNEKSMQTTPCRRSILALAPESAIHVSTQNMKLFARLTLLVASALFAFTATAQTDAKAPQIDPHFQIPASDDGLPGAGPIRRYDWFRNLWAERRSAWASHAEQDKNAWVFLGDSITQGWGDDMGGNFPGMKVANRGISGDTTRGVLIRLQEDVLSLHPSGVVILIGTNDLEEQADPETIAANLKLILAELKKLDPKMPVILCQVFPSSTTAKRPADQIKKINALYAAAVKGDAQITVIETWPLFADAQGDAKAAEFPDLLHPNAIGYAKWAAALRPIFATLGFLETDPDNFTPEPGFVSLFNGRDLTGWGYRTNNFDGKTTSSEGRYVAKNGRLIVTAPPEGSKIAQLDTTREFPNDFVLKLEFRATPNADSGIFIRKPQLQCRDYLIAGPYKTLAQYKPQDWNEIIVTVQGGVAHCTCNGEVIEDAMAVPATGPIGLEGDRGQMEYRRIRLKELAPATNATLMYGARPGSKVTIDGTSTIHDWTVEGAIIGGIFEIDPAFQADKTLKGVACLNTRGKAPIATITIPVRSLKSKVAVASQRMDEVMYEAMRIKENPKITYKLNEMVIKGAVPDSGTPVKFDTKGELMVSGVTNTIDMEVAMERIASPDGEMLKFAGSKVVKMTDFKIQPPAPKLAMGAIKTGDEVTVKFEWVTGQKKDAAPAPVK